MTVGSGDGAAGAPSRGASTVGHAGGGAPISSLPRAVREGAPVYGGAQVSVAGVAGLACLRSRWEFGTSGSVVFGAAIPAAALGREQCAVRGAGSGTGPESGVSGSGIESAESGGGRRGDPRVSGKDLTSLRTFIQTPSRVWVESPSVLYLGLRPRFPVAFSLFT